MRQPRATSGAGSKAEFLRPQHTGHGHIPAVHQFAVHLQPHPGAQAVLHKRLVGFCQTQLPGKAGVINGVLGRGSGAAVVAGDEHRLRPGLGHARRDGTHARLAYQFHRDGSVAVGALEVVYELGQVFYGIYIVVGRGRDEGHAGRGTAGAGNPGPDLAAGQMPAPPGFAPWAILI